MTGGETAQVHVEEGEELRVAWRSEDRSQSAVLGGFTVPGAGVVASGSVSIDYVDQPDDLVVLTVGSLDAVGGNADLVVENRDTGAETTQSVSSSGSETVSLITSGGDSVRATLYESGRTNQLSRDLADAPGASVRFDNAETDGEFNFTVTSMFGTSQVFAVIDDDPAVNGDADEVTTFVSSGQVDDKQTVNLDGSKVAGGETLTVTIYATDERNVQLAQADNN